MNTVVSLAVGLSAMSVPSVPPAVGTNAIALQRSVATAIQAQQPGLAIEPGTYVFSNTNLEITGATDLAIDAYNVTLVFYFGYGVQITNCNNVSVRGLTFDSDPPNYAQGIVTSLSPGGYRFVARFDDRFIPPDVTKQPFSAPGGLAGAKVAFWNKGGATVLSEAHVNFMNSSHDLGGGSFEIGLTHAIGDAGAQQLVPGTTPVTVWPRRGITLQVTNSSRALVEDASIWAGGNMGVHETLGEGAHVYRRLRIVRKPGWPGLMALNADGFHSSDVGTGPTLEQSEISYTGDDFVNVHNRMLVVCKRFNSSSASMGTSLAVVDPSNGGLSSARAGDRISFYALLPGQVRRANPLLGTGVLSTAPERVLEPATLSWCHQAAQTMQAPPYNAQLAVSVSNAPVYRVDFTAPLPQNCTEPLFQLANFERRSGANALLRQNYFHDSCGSGGRVSIKALNATAIGNVMERFGGVHVYSEPEWLEGDLGIRNVLLDGNTIVDGVPAEHIDVFNGLSNITCVNTTFVSQGNRTHRATGC